MEGAAGGGAGTLSSSLTSTSTHAGALARNKYHLKVTHDIRGAQAALLPLAASIFHPHVSMEGFQTYSRAFAVPPLEFASFALPLELGVPVDLEFVGPASLLTRDALRPLTSQQADRMTLAYADFCQRAGAAPPLSVRGTQFEAWAAATMHGKGYRLGGTVPLVGVRSVMEGAALLQRVATEYARKEEEYVRAHRPEALVAGAWGPTPNLLTFVEMLRTCLDVAGVLGRLDFTTSSLLGLGSASSNAAGTPAGPATSGSSFERAFSALLAAAAVGILYQTSTPAMAQALDASEQGTLARLRSDPTASLAPGAGAAHTFAAEMGGGWRPPHAHREAEGSRGGRSVSRERHDRGGRGGRYERDERDERDGRGGRAGRDERSGRNGRGERDERGGSERRGRSERDQEGAGAGGRGRSRSRSRSRSRGRGRGRGGASAADREDTERAEGGQRQVAFVATDANTRANGGPSIRASRREGGGRGRRDSVSSASSGATGASKGSMRPEEDGLAPWKPVPGEVAILATTGHWARYMQGKPKDTLYSHFDVAACPCCGAVECKHRACRGSGKYPTVQDLDVYMATRDALKAQHAAWRSKGAS